MDIRYWKTGLTKIRGTFKVHYGNWQTNSGFEYFAHDIITLSIPNAMESLTCNEIMGLSVDCKAIAEKQKMYRHIKKQI